MVSIYMYMYIEQVYYKVSGSLINHTIPLSSKLWNKSIPFWMNTRSIPLRYVWSSQAVDHKLSDIFRVALSIVYQSFVSLNTLYICV